jgi:two-component system, OmpR family, sensor histidine kinase MprB
VSLTTRISVFVAVSVGVAVAIVALFSYSFARDEALNEVDGFLSSRSPIVGVFGVVQLDDFRSRPGFGSGNDPQPGRPGSVDDVIRDDAVAQFVDSSGTVLTFGSPDALLPVGSADVALADHDGADLFQDVEVDGIHYRMMTRHLAPGLAIQVARDVTGTDEILAGLRLRLTLLGFAGVVLAAAVGWLVSRRSLRPVGVLTEAAEHVAETQSLNARIEVVRDDELGRLARTFNSMLATLEEARASQQRLIADASHELRTPLTSVRTNIELLQRGAVKGQEREELLADLGSEAVELSHLVAELVDLATIGRQEEPTVELDLADIVAQAVARVRRHSHLDVMMDLAPTIVDGMPHGLLRAVSNLLENAAKWGSEGSELAVTLNAGTLTVRDHGPGIPEDDIARVFERFYRSPEARALPGSGLGLSIVAAVVDAHGGTVFARNAPDGGAVVGFTVPISDG